jgi:hypothetical protein
VAREIHGRFLREGIDVLAQEWDNLVILDACRYDMFAAQSQLPGELHRRESAGSNTPEFLQSNFQNSDLSDTVYVTANPQVNVYLKHEPFEIINVWEDHWDDEYNTVPPGIMTEKTLEAYRSYPNKRLISHFIQPHYPFIGEIGQNKLNTHSGMELSKRVATGGEARRDNKSVWEQMYEHTISAETVWKAYRENLELTLPYIENLVQSFDEYTVVTSDHGNALGERVWPIPSKIYGHPNGIRIPALVDVPWLVTNTGNRKEIYAEESSTARATPDDSISQRLSDLGYK